jgi:hypothetical protein
MLPICHIALVGIFASSISILPIYLCLSNLETRDSLLYAMMSRQLVAFLGLAGTFRIVLAHEHHTDNIPEGAGISPDPIVSCF